MHTADTEQLGWTAATPKCVPGVLYGTVVGTRARRPPISTEIGETTIRIAFAARQGRKTIPVLAVAITPATCSLQKFAYNFFIIIVIRSIIRITCGVCVSEQNTPFLICRQIPTFGANLYSRFPVIKTTVLFAISLYLSR